MSGRSMKEDSPVSKIAVERRSSPRQDRTFDVEGAALEGGELARMKARDLSLGGLYCTSPADFAEMTRLAVRLLLPGRNGSRMEPFDIEAVVVRRKEVASLSGSPRFELALYFHGVTDAQRKRLAAYLER